MQNKQNPDYKEHNEHDYKEHYKEHNRPYQKKTPEPPEPQARGSVPVGRPIGRQINKADPCYTLKFNLTNGSLKIGKSKFCDFVSQTYQSDFKQGLTRDDPRTWLSKYLDTFVQFLNLAIGLMIAEKTTSWIDSGSPPSTEPGDVGHLMKTIKEGPAAWLFEPIVESTLLVFEVNAARDCVVASEHWITEKATVGDLLREVSEVYSVSIDAIYLQHGLSVISNRDAKKTLLSETVVDCRSVLQLIRGKKPNKEAVLEYIFVWMG